MMTIEQIQAEVDAASPHGEEALQRARAYETDQHPVREDSGSTAILAEHFQPLIDKIAKLEDQFNIAYGSERARAEKAERERDDLNQKIAKLEEYEKRSRDTNISINSSRTVCVYGNKYIGTLCSKPAQAGSIYCSVHEPRKRRLFESKK